MRLGLDFQRMLRINHVLYIAARSVAAPRALPSCLPALSSRVSVSVSSRDHVFAVNLAASSEQIIPQQVGDGPFSCLRPPDLSSGAVDAGLSHGDETALRVPGTAARLSISLL